ncbi:Ribonuclease VapC9 [uncultured archaeon]|nr:Ribonuclease VapC9 [uncultured archaeon]
MAFNRIWGDKIHKTVILDSNAILMFFEFSIDWEKELSRLLGGYHLVVPTAVIQELRILATRNKGQKKAAAALKLIGKYDTISQEANTADEALMKIAEKTQGIVVTNDIELRDRLKNRGFPVIFLRGKKKLVLDE